MGYLSYVLKILELAPAVIAGVEQIAREKDSATKRQMAHDALTLASGVAAYVVPADTSIISTLSQLTHSVIDLHLGRFSTPASTPVPVSTPAPVPVSESSSLPQGS